MKQIIWVDELVEFLTATYTSIGIVVFNYGVGREEGDHTLETLTLTGANRIRRHN